MSDDERLDARIAAALGAAADAVDPPDAWNAVARRLDAGERGARRARAVWPVAAAAAVVLLLVGATIAARAGSEDREVETRTAGSVPAPAAGFDPTIPIVALTTDNRLVELDHDGREVRVIYAGPVPEPGHLAGVLRGPLAVSPVDRTIYVEQRVDDPTCPGTEDPDTQPVGAILAVPWDGGEPRVVSETGRVPAIAPGGTRLSVISDRGVTTPAAIGAGVPGLHCANTLDQRMVDIVSLDADSGFGAGLGGVVRPDGAVDPVGPVRVAFVDDDRLVVQTHQIDKDDVRSCPRCGPVVYRVYDAGTPHELAHAIDGVRHEGEPTGAPSAPGDEREAFAVVAHPAGAPAGRYDLLAGGIRDGRIELAASSIDAATSTAVASRPLVSIDPSTVGDGRYAAVDVAPTADGTNVLVTATFDPAVPGGARGHSLILWNGPTRLLARDVLAASWAELRP